MMGREATMGIVESNGGGCHDLEFPALGAIEESEVCFYQIVEFVGYFLSCP